MGKTGIENKNYSPEFKISVIMDMREHQLGYKETARKYDLVRQSKFEVLFYYYLKSKDTDKYKEVKDDCVILHIVKSKFVANQRNA